MDPFWGPIVAEVLKKIASNAVQSVGDIFRALWEKKNAPPPPNATPFNTPPLLPQTLTPLVGREADFAGVLGALSNYRLVTITGLGGVGKTALAQTIARWTWETEREKNKKNPRGVPYLALDALTSGRELADYVRRKLLPDSVPPANLDENARLEDAARVVANALNANARLLVLDNFESVLDGEGAREAVDFITRLVTQTDESVRFLMTSRRLLQPQIDIEGEYPLDPLELKAAVELFYQRAQIERSAHHDQYVREICQAVDNLPLGVELAARAVRYAHRPLKEVAEGVRVTPLDAQAAAALNYPERQQGLMASYRYTFEHLSREAQRLFCEFSIFRGGADRAAVQAIDGTESWERALGELVDWHLLLVTEKDDTFRYSMLATTEAFAQWAMEHAGKSLGLDENELQRRHAEYYVTFVEHSGVQEIERENIFKGADWCHGAKEWSLLKRCLHAIFPYLLSWNRTQFATRCVQSYDAGLRVITLVGMGGAGKTWLAEIITKSFRGSSVDRQSLWIDRHIYTENYSELLGRLQNIEFERRAEPQLLATIDGVDEFLKVDELGLALAVRDVIHILPQSVFLITSRRPIDWLPQDVEQETLVVGNLDRAGGRQMWRELVHSYGVDAGLESEGEFELMFELTQGMPLAMAMIASALAGGRIRTLEDVKTGLNNLMVTGVFERFLGYLSPTEKDVLLGLAASDEGLTYEQMKTEFPIPNLREVLHRLTDAVVIRELNSRYVLHDVIKDLLRGKHRNQ